MLLKYVLAWLGMMFLAIANGGLRDCLCPPTLATSPPTRISTVLLLLLFAAYFRTLVALWPPVSSAQAWTIGLIWLLLTLAFEFGFGYFIAGHPWSRLIFEYNILAGRIWVLIPLWVLTGPVLFSISDNTMCHRESAQGTRPPGQQRAPRQTATRLAPPQFGRTTRYLQAWWSFYAPNKLIKNV